MNQLFNNENCHELRHQSNLNEQDWSLEFQWIKQSALLKKGDNNEAEEDDEDDDDDGYSDDDGDDDNNDLS